MEIDLLSKGPRLIKARMEHGDEANTADQDGYPFESATSASSVFHLYCCKVNRTPKYATQKQVQGRLQQKPNHLTATGTKNKKATPKGAALCIISLSDLSSPFKWTGGANQGVLLQNCFQFGIQSRASEVFAHDLAVGIYQEVLGNALHPVKSCCFVVPEF